MAQYPSTGRAARAQRQTRDMQHVLDRLLLKMKGDARRRRRRRRTVERLHALKLLFTAARHRNGRSARFVARDIICQLCDILPLHLIFLDSAFIRRLARMHILCIVAAVGCQAQISHIPDARADLIKKITVV